MKHTDERVLTERRQTETIRTRLLTNHKILEEEKIEEKLRHTVDATHTYTNTH